MESKYIDLVSGEMNASRRGVAAVLALLGEGATVPFIARYRKEATGSMDEVEITAIRDRRKQLKELDDRRDTVLKSIEEQGKLNPGLRDKINAAGNMTQLEDIYLPYRPKRRTRAIMAKEKGLEPLAEMLFRQDEQSPERLASGFVNPAKDVGSVEDALAGARDILAERVNEDARARTRMRRLFERKGKIVTKMVKGKEMEGAKYRDYFDWDEPLARAPSHRLLAMRRAEKEKIITMKIQPDEDNALYELDRIFLRGRSPATDQVAQAVKDGYKRLLSPSMETEMRLSSKKKADEEAIKVFAENLRQLLLSAPLGQKNVMALDPGFRTGCKLVCLDRQGKLLTNDVIYPHPPVSREGQAADKVRHLIKQYNIEAIAVGNGTAGRETESFLRNVGLDSKVAVVMVNESGASIYSASEVAREEFPNEDLTVRGAVSIGRRLMDPLAELVKIDPKSIGVGQYQHDVDQNALRQSLDDVVGSCVNGVGVEVNTASKQLLTYVSGLGPVLAGNIIKYRDANGPFRARKELKKVSRLGDKAFQQAAGFLRIYAGKNPLDASAVHPESYPIVDRMAKDQGCTVLDLLEKEDLRKQIDLKRYVSEQVGLPTLKDILKELAKPGRDPREQFEVFSFKEGVEKMSDLGEGMVLPGIVTNITRFGAFVDIGVHQDGLVHISQIADRYVQDPAEVVKVQQKVMVRVVEVDLQRKRIALSMKGVKP
ncbi:MAG TPA: RNA-binding transcriptional accessory protein [Bacteroidetes bacterium]|nr:RNA-binding transcriptional accessory protein [Bacteroidota bacterium]